MDAYLEMLLGGFIIFMTVIACLFASAIVLHVGLTYVCLKLRDFFGACVDRLLCREERSRRRHLSFKEEIRAIMSEVAGYSPTGDPLSAWDQPEMQFIRETALLYRREFSSDRLSITEQ